MRNKTPNATDDIQRTEYRQIKNNGLAQYGNHSGERSAVEEEVK